VIFAKEDQVSYTDWAECMNLAEFHHFNASYKLCATCLDYFSECLKQLAESLGVRPSPWVFGQVPGCSAKSPDGLPTHFRVTGLA
jgi:hypothetical protein